jgi:hypothetical protein
MSSFDHDLNVRIEKEFTKHGWQQIAKGPITFYQRPLSISAYERMVRSKKVTTSKRRKGIQAMKRFLKSFIHKG